MTLSLAYIFLSSNENIWIYLAAGAGLGVYLFYRGFRMLQRKRLILDTPSSKIRSASIGLVEVSGLAVGPYTITAPISSLPCYYHRTLAWQLKQSGKSSKWVKVAEESLHVPFYLDDNTARVLVDPQGAEMEIHRDFHEEYGGFGFGALDMPANVASFLARHGVANDRKLKVDEYCIKPKNALFVLGTLAENPGLTVSATPVPNLSGVHSLNLPDRLAGRTGATEPQPDGVVKQTFSFSVSGGSSASLGFSSVRTGAGSLDPAQQHKVAEAMRKAGIANPAAWAAVGLPYGGVEATPAVAAESGAAAAPAQAFDLNPKTVLMKGAHDPAFFISWRSQKDVVQSLAWKSAAMIWGGPALTLLCVYILAAHFGWL